MSRLLLGVSSRRLALVVAAVFHMVKILIICGEAAKKRLRQYRYNYRLLACTAQDYPFKRSKIMQQS